MTVSPRRAMAAAVAIAGLLGLTYAVWVGDAPRHTAPGTNVIVVPGPDQVSGTVDTFGMDWLSRFSGAGSVSAGR
jgi:hypothetical protein